MAEQPASVDAALQDAEHAMAEFDRLTLAGLEVRTRLEAARGESVPDPEALAREEKRFKEACLEAARQAKTLAANLETLKGRMEAVYLRMSEMQSVLLSWIGRLAPPGEPSAN